MIPYCLCKRELWISSGPRIYLKRFCILGARIPGGYCGALGIIVNFCRSGYSTSDNQIIHYTQYIKLYTIYITNKYDDC